MYVFWEGTPETAIYFVNILGNDMSIFKFKILTKNYGAYT